MPSKVNPNDWDTFFSSTGPRRSGPVGIFIRTVILLGVIGGLGYGLLAFNRQLEAKKESSDKTAVALAPTRTAQALASAVTPQPSPTPNLPTGRALKQTPLRDKPAEGGSSLGNLNPNDRVQFIKSQDAEGQLWWQIRLSERATNATGAAPEGSTGWAPASALTEPSELPPTEAPVPGTPPPASLPPVTLNGANLNLYRDQQTSISVSRDPRWNQQSLAGVQLGVFMAPTPDGGEGVVAAKVVGVNQDAAGFQAAISQVAVALAKPGTAPEVAYTAQRPDGLDATIKLTRVVGGQDITVRGRVTTKPAPGSSVGVTMAFVPDNSFAANEGVLNQIIQGTIFQ